MAAPELHLPPGQLVEYQTLPVVDVGHPSRWSHSPDKWPLVVVDQNKTLRRLTLGQLKGYAEHAVRKKADLHCVSRWSKRGIRWAGVSPRALFPDLTTTGDTRLARITCSGGYTVLLSVEELLAVGTLLAWEMDSAKLPHRHGGPLRLVVTSRYAWKSAKWVRRIEILPPGTDVEKSRTETYWESRGFDPHADPAKEERLRADLGLHLSLSGQLPRKDPSLVVLSSVWGDGVTEFLSDSALRLLNHALSQGRSFHYAGPCACRPNFVRGMLKINPGLPIFFFGHGHVVRPDQVLYARLLGQPGHGDREIALLERGRDESLLAGRLIYAIGCHSSELVDEKTASELKITLIGFPDRIYVPKDNMLPHFGLGQLQNDCYLAGAKTLLDGKTAEMALLTINDSLADLDSMWRKHVRGRREAPTGAAVFTVGSQSLTYLHAIHRHPKAVIVGDPTTQIPPA